MHGCFASMQAALAGKQRWYLRGEGGAQRGPPLPELQQSHLETSDVSLDGGVQ